DLVAGSAFVALGNVSRSVLAGRSLPVRLSPPRPLPLNGLQLFGFGGRQVVKIHHLPPSPTGGRRCRKSDTLAGRCVKLRRFRCNICYTSGQVSGARNNAPRPVQVL